MSIELIIQRIIIAYPLPEVVRKRKRRKGRKKRVTLGQLIQEIIDDLEE